MAPDEARPLHIVNFSGGKDSTYMLLEMIRRDIYFDMVVNVDTGIEFPAMYDHIDQVERFLQAERGMNITRLHPPQSFEELMFHAVKETAAPGDIPGYGWPAIKVRWCTGHLKVHIINRYLSGLPVQPYHYIAFAADEQHRLKRKNNQETYKRYPLVEWGVTEAQALAGCYEAGYTWGGLYERFSRVSCWCCPLQGLNDLRALWEFYPEIWEKLRIMDDRAIAQFGHDNPYGQFKQQSSVRMLEVRFSFEREWWPVHGKAKTAAFWAALYERYMEYQDYIGFQVKPTATQQKILASKERVAALLPFVTDSSLDKYLFDDLSLSTKAKKKQGRKRPVDRSR